MTRLVARVHVLDSTVATLDGVRVRPLRAGWTPIDVGVGDQATGVGVTVYAPVRTFAGLRPDQQFVAVPVRLAQGEAVRWPLPPGLFWLGFLRGPTARVGPTLHVDGPILCTRWPALAAGEGRLHCLARAPGATVTIANLGEARLGPGAQEVVGALALAQEKDSERPDGPTPRSSPP